MPDGSGVIALFEKSRGAMRAVEIAQFKSVSAEPGHKRDLGH